MRPIRRFLASAASKAAVAAPSPKVEPVVVEFSDVAVAKHRVAAGAVSSGEGQHLHAGVVRTMCTKNTQLSAMTGCELYLKKEHSQRTGSFKDRGACNALRKLVETKGSVSGAIAASAGNHALAMAYNGRALGIPITVVMPTVAPLTKVQRCRDYGARVVIHGAHILESYEHGASRRAPPLSRARGATGVVHVVARAPHSCFSYLPSRCARTSTQ